VRESVCGVCVERVECVWRECVRVREIVCVECMERVECVCGECVCGVCVERVCTCVRVCVLVNVCVCAVIRHLIYVNRHFDAEMKAGVCSNRM